MPQLTQSYTPDNLNSLNDHIETTQQWIDEEISLGRMSGPFSKTELESKIGHFRSSPLQIVSKIPFPGAPAKHRVCVNLSFQGDEDLSINDYIQSDDFPTRWGTVHQCAELVANAPPGSQAATLDIEGAYRTIPVAPWHKRFLIIMLMAAYFITHVVHFGLRSASGLQGEVADAIVDILFAIGIGPILKWVDDFLVFRMPVADGPFKDVVNNKPFRYAYDLVLLKALIAPLGTPWHLLKYSDFGDTFEYGGFRWTISTTTVSLPEDKRLKHLAKVDFFLVKSARFSLKDFQSLLGSLMHLSFILPIGRTYITHLLDIVVKFHKLASLRHRHSVTWTIPRVLRKEIQWWRDRLLKPEDLQRSVARPPPVTDMGIWVDASTSWGIGILVDGQWDAWRLTPQAVVSEFNKDIAHLEALAIEFVIRYLVASNIRDRHLLVRSDNQSVIDSLRKFWSRNRNVNASIRRSISLLDSHSLSIHPIYVPSAENLADPISRGVIPTSDRLPNFYDIPPQFSSHLIRVI